jgi:predicted GH43/DUF377 family glycosyl hydrolase
MRLFRACAILAMCGVGWSAPAGGARANPPVDSTGRPQIKKLGTVDVDKVENSPIVFGGKLYRCEWFRNAGCFHFVDCHSGRATPQFAKGWSFGNAFVESDTVYVTGTRPGKEVRMWSSRDLERWDTWTALDLPGFQIFNTSICKADGKYVMMFEIDSPKEQAGVPFTARFATSTDLKRWAVTGPECVYAKDRYTAPHCLRYLDGYYYNFYLESIRGGYEQFVVRSRDLIQWESSPLNPVLRASDDDRQIRNAKLSPQDRRRIAAAKNLNNSDIDFCEYRGRVVIFYSWGNQQGVEHLAEAVYEGSSADFLRGWFPPPAKVKPPAAATTYSDGRPAATLRVNAKDQGVVLRYGDGPDRCDYLGAREAIVFEANGTYYLHYDGAGPRGWLACLATSRDLAHWTKKGPILQFGVADEPDSACASAPWVYFDGKSWHMFYVATSLATPAPDYIPAVPYVTCKAKSVAPGGPWIKQKDVVPFRPKPKSYYSDTASAGCIVRRAGENLMFFSAAAGPPFRRTLGIARTDDLDGPWRVDPKPIVPLDEQIENSSLYFEPANQTWFLFTNHVGVDARGEYTDAVWVYWSKDLNRWDARRKAVVLDRQNCDWSPVCIGMPTVIRVKDRLAVLYDGPGGKSIDHMRRNIGLAWLDLPLTPPDATPSKEFSSTAGSK